MNDRERKSALRPDDRELVDLLTAVLVDPNLHTDLRMRLHREVSAILRAAREELDREAADKVHAHEVEPQEEPLPDLLRAVLVDPDLYTDLRMRLHREIRLVVSRTHESHPV